ncbi:MAG: N-formylglutamate amidohydrolase [Muribaculaceae bacterium]|nr:N-formylglutamate amidohydrolase [Muribaculaceae bacterium]
MSRHIVLNIPHSSIVGIFDRELGRWPINPHFLNSHVRELTDWYTDMLFATDNERVTSIVFPYSRFVCDVERLDDDPMEAIGQGIIYRKAGGYQRGELDAATEQRLLQLRDNHIKRLTVALSPGDLLLDCHSFSDTDHSHADICIGCNNDWSYCESDIDMVVNAFRQGGYSLSVNTPYGGAINPDTGFTYSALMIEVNKRVYMNPSQLTLDNRQWTRWLSCLHRLYDNLIDINTF